MALNSFEKALAEFCELVDGEVTEQEVDKAWVKTAHAVDDLSEWSDEPPVPCIFRVNNPLSYSESVLTSAESALSCISIGNAIGTWNAKGSGKYAAGEDWIVARVLLEQEQADGDDMEEAPGDYVQMSYGLWRSGDQWIGVLWDGHPKDILKMMGLAKEPKWQDCQIWYGE